MRVCSTEARSRSQFKRAVAALPPDHGPLTREEALIEASKGLMSIIVNPEEFGTTEEREFHAGSWERRRHAV